MNTKAKNLLKLLYLRIQTQQISIFDKYLISSTLLLKHSEWASENVKKPPKKDMSMSMLKKTSDREQF